MKLKTLQIGTDMRESIPYGERSIPIAVCTDNFDDYFHREWGCHWHDETEFEIVQKGTAEFSIYSGKEQSAIILRQGDGIFINSGCLHSVKALAPNTVMSGFALPITFFYKPFESAAHQIISPVTGSDVSYLTFEADDENDRPLLSSIDEICNVDESETGYELHYIEMVCKIWRLLTVRILQNEQAGAPAVNKSQERRVKQMLSFIHTHYSEHIGIDDIARSAAVSRTECFRCFNAVLKKSPSEYLTEYRLSMALMMLANTDRTLSDISFSCGFNSPSYFGKLFREQCGMPPKLYRENIRKQ